MELNNELLFKLRDGAVSFNQFAARTRNDYIALATSVIRVWGLPPAIERDDVVQEMLLATMINVPQFREGVGTSIHGFIVFRMREAAWKYLRASVRQKQRDQLCETVKVRVDPQLTVQSDVEKLIARVANSPLQTVVAMSIYNTQCYERTTDALLNDPTTRAMFQNHERESVRRNVQRTVCLLTQRACAMA